MVQHNADRCPKCDSGLVDALAQDAGIRRYQCRACGENFTAILGSRMLGEHPGEPVARMPDDPHLKSKTPYKNFRFGEDMWKSPFSRTALEEAKEKEANVANLTCEFCPGMKFKSPKSLGAHRWQKHPKAPKAKKATTHEHMPTNPDDPILSLLKSRRQELIDSFIKSNPEISRLDKVIEGLSPSADPS